MNGLGVEMRVKEESQAGSKGRAREKEETWGYGRLRVGKRRERRKKVVESRDKRMAVAVVHRSLFLVTRQSVSSSVNSSVHCPSYPRNGLGNKSNKTNTKSTSTSRIRPPTCTHPPTHSGPVRSDQTFQIRAYSHVSSECTYSPHCPT